MDPGVSREHVEHLLSRMEVAVAERGTQAARSKLSVEKILEECDDTVIVIGAHVNAPDGLLEHDGQQRLAELRDYRLAAVEIDPGYSIDESWLDGSKPEIGRRVSMIWSSDAHRFCELGRRFTWIKMTEPNLEGLRLALSDGSDSLKPAERSSSGDPNHDRAGLVIEGIVVKNAKLIGRIEPTVIHFNPWMNAIIGGRGTGKSTIVDLCRKVLRRDDELDGTNSTDEGSLRQLFDRRMRVAESRTEDGLLTGETAIEITYRKDGERFRISWGQNGEATTISRIVGDSLCVEEGDVRERFPVRIYSQKQLFALAQDPDALLTVIDDSSVVRGRELSRQMEQLETTYLAQCAEARATSARASTLPALNASLSDVTRKLDLLQQCGHAEVLNRYRTRRDMHEGWDTSLSSAERAVESVRTAVNEISIVELDIGPETEDDEARAALRRAHQSLQDTTQSFYQDVLDRTNLAESQITNIRSASDISEWQAALQESEAEYTQVAARLQEEGIADPDEYSELLDQAARLRTEIQSLEGLTAQADEINSGASETLRAYRQARNELSNRRKEIAVQASSATLKVEVVPYARHAGLADDLSGILGIERFEEDRNAVADSIRPTDGEEWDWGKLDEMTLRMRQFLSGETESWDCHDRRFEAALRRVDPEEIDRMALYLPADAVRVRFNDGRLGSSWRSLSQGSPGQQTAALLAFVLGFGNEPIILDQPEDDLDNTLIYELLVARLREQKFRRQIIVITHNPNIVVHGDAEFVVSLNVSESLMVIECQGGLQERSVRDEICRVMEGGREAFTTRYRRIIPPGAS